MNIIEITEANALAAFKEGTVETKKTLERLFHGKINFYANIRERIKTAQDAYAYNGVTEEQVIPALARPYLTEREIADRELEQITLALNEGVKPSYKDGKVKYIAFFEQSASGFRLAGTVSVLTHSRAGAGSRFVFFDSENCVYAATQFIDRYEIINNK